MIFIFILGSKDILKEIWNAWGWVHDDRLFNSWAVALRACLKKCKWQVSSSSKWWGSSSLDGLSVLNTSPLGEACKHAPRWPQDKGEQLGIVSPAVWHHDLTAEVKESLVLQRCRHTPLKCSLTKSHSDHRQLLSSGRLQGIWNAFEEEVVALLGTRSVGWR